MNATALSRPATVLPAGVNALDYGRALLNILEDASSEQLQLRHTQKAMLNILEDSAGEKQPFRDSQRAVLNILEDFSEEKARLEEMKTAVLNILEDLAVEKERLEETQKTVRSSLREKVTLLKEIHHRVKNNLQVIVSLLRLQARHLKDEQSRAMFVESQNRVYSISLVHEMLYGAGDLARVDFQAYLLTLTSGLMDGWKGSGASIDLLVEAQGVLLGVDTAIPCGLIVTELVTNSLKYAFPDRTSGRIRVAAAREPVGSMTLTVEDDGVGLAEGLELRRSGSLGLKLVDSLVRQLDAKIEIRRQGGASFVIRCQLPGN